MANDVQVRSSSTLADLSNPTQRAAAVLVSVGPTLASKVLAHLSEGEVEAIAFEVATMGDVAPQQMSELLREFYEEARAAQQLVSGGEQSAREMLRMWRGDAADEIVDRLLAAVQTSPFHFLRMHEPAQVCHHLRDEHPQTVALILSHLPTRFAAQILTGLEPEVQGEVAMRIATMEPAAPEAIAQVERALHERLGGQARRVRRAERSGARELAGMLNNADRGTERAILGALEAAMPELAEQVRALMFVFEDIVTLDDRSMQVILRQLDTKRLALALKGTAPEVRDKVMRNLSERARETLEEETELMGPVRVREVEAAQSEVVALIRRLDEAGELQISRGQGDDGLVE